MNRNFYDRGGTYFRQCRVLLLAIVVGFGVVSENNAQTKLNRAEFERLPLMSRAAFFEREILNAARVEGVDPNILWAIAYNETRFRPWLRSPKNAKGLMQFIPATAARFNLHNPYQPTPAIRAAAKYVRYLSKMFNGRIDSILAAYNSGEGTVSAYMSGRTLRTKRKVINRRGIKTIGGVPPYRETIGYVGRGLKVYRWLIRNRKFPESVSSANFPTAISSSVARVYFYDREIEKIPSKYKVLRRNTSINSVTSAKIVGKQSESVNNAETKRSETTEVYYEPRSGGRYRVENGRKIKLSDSGILVINRNISGEKTNLARSTFFRNLLTNRVGYCL